MANKAVVLGANYYIGLSTIRCLGVHGVHVAAVDYAWKVPMDLSPSIVPKR